MGYQIIEQRDNVYAVFSSFDSTIVVADATAAEITDWFVQRLVDQVGETRNRIVAIIADVADGHPELPYRHAAMTWEQAQRKDREHNGQYSLGEFTSDTDPRDNRYAVLDTSDGDHLRTSLAKLHPTTQAMILTALTDLPRKGTGT